SFVVEVTGTRFTVDEGSVRVSEGSVRISSPAGALLDDHVGPGEAWHFASERAERGERVAIAEARAIASAEAAADEAAPDEARATDAASEDAQRRAPIVREVAIGADRRRTAPAPRAQIADQDVVAVREAPVGVGPAPTARERFAAAASLERTDPAAA